ncbi:MAG: alpha-galactosidase [Tannerellaceae bacterium]|nr:alpha-galactosidase [Tannerellaceae bacterium]
MKKNILKTLFIVGTILQTGTLTAQTIHISTPATSMVLSAPAGGELKYLYYGNKLSPTDLQNIEHAPTMHHTVYPVYGLNCPGETALAVTHADGNMTLQMEVIKVNTTSIENANLVTIEMKDKIYPFHLNLCYKAYQDADIIETWTQISHQEKTPVLLNQFASAHLPVRRGNVWLTHLHGSWANEGQLSQEPLQPGMKIIKNKDGVRNSHTAHAEIMFSLDGKPHENSGHIIGAALCYSGNYKLRIETDDSEYHQFYAGINEENSAYNLKKGEIFTTPPVAFTYSTEGLSGCSRNFHKWARTYKLAHGHTPRKILLNSWEGVYFDIRETGMQQMMNDIASMGGELFVMDDGWFGDKYPRNSDNSSLGDWTTDKNKLPGGISKLIHHAEQQGIKFGIWIEPEMANTTSQLYEKHPQWIIKAPQREPVLGRGGTQVVLDLSNPQVQDFIVNIVDNLMNNHPGIEYIKWDANMAIMNHGSTYLTKDNQSHLYIEFHRGFENICQRIRAKYPHLTIQACASGGGRANYGILPYFDEFWVSDNTDALQRIYMQWGTSYFFPAIAMASHISTAPNHQTFRTIPLKYRIDVAMSGRLGLEIQPADMTEEEKQLCRKAITDYKKIRTIVQFGDIYRLASPYDKQGVASLMYITPEKEKAVFYWWKTEHFYNQHLPRIKMAGLNPAKTYKITELNRIDNVPLDFEGKTFSGAYLMANGLEIPYNHKVDYHKQTDYSSRILYLEETKEDQRIRNKE